MNPMKITVLLVFAVFYALPSILARGPDLDSAEMWTGTWRASDGQTMKIRFGHGNSATITYSHGWAPDTGRMNPDGETMMSQGAPSPERIFLIPRERSLSTPFIVPSP